MTMQPRELAEKIATIADDKKGKDILLLNMEGISYMTDYFVIASASNTTLVRAIADAIEDKLAEQEVFCSHKEGYNEGRWVLMDFGDAVVHIFLEEERDFYNLEQMMDNNLQYKAGDVVTLKVVRVSDMGAFLDAGTGDTSDDILLHKLQQTTPVKVGDEVRVYLYLDPHKRLTASMKLPKMKEGQLGYAKVISVTRDGGFVDIGAERGVFLPYTEMLGRVNPNQKIWIKLYRDKSGRPAVTMKVDKDLARAAKPIGEEAKVGDTVTGTIYNITKEGFFIFTNDRHIAFLHRSEADPKRYLAYGEQVTARITFIREDGHVDVSLRKQKENAMVDDAAAVPERAHALL